MKIEKLQTIKNYSVNNGVTASYIYKLIKSGSMQPVTIDGVKFIDTVKFPALPKK